MIAHLVQTGFGGFYDGILHVLVTVEDLLLVVGLCLLAGARGKPAARAVLLTLPMAWCLGGVAGAFTASEASLLWPTTLSFSVIGALVAINARVRQGAVFVVLAGTAGGLHGFANGASMDKDSEQVLVLGGIALTVFALTSLLSAFVVSLRAEWHRIAVRVAGSWIAAIGLLMIGWAMRGGSAG